MRGAKAVIVTVCLFIREAIPCGKCIQVKVFDFS